MSDLSRAYGVAPNPPPEILAAAMLRKADIEAHHDEVPRHIAGWLARLADELHDQPRQNTEREAARVAGEAVRTLKTHQAVAVLALIGPFEQLAGTPREVSLQARAHVAKLLPGVCRTVLRRLGGVRSDVDAMLAYEQTLDDE